MNKANPAQTGLIFIPVLFVLLWSTGFIGARFGLPHADPMAFLSARFAIVMVILAGVARATGAPWPARRGAWHSFVSGILLHGLYLGGVFWSISLGMPAGISALIVGLQPLATALLSRPLLGVAVSRRQWAGTLLGLAGLALVLLPAAFPDPSAGNVTILNLLLSLGALAGITLGTIYQKAFSAGADMRSGGVWQYLGGFIPVTLVALASGQTRIEWTLPFIGALGWLVVVLSLGAISLLMWLIRHGDVARIASLFYLVPPVTALVAWRLFDERLVPVQMLGMAVAAYAVWLASRRS